jgi:hypothetical protein
MRHLSPIFTLLACLLLPTSAHASRDCGTVKTSRYTGAHAVEVTISRGSASCAEARTIASKFQSRDPGAFHGTNLASGHWLVYGWQCQRGTDGRSGTKRSGTSERKARGKLSPKNKLAIHKNATKTHVSLASSSHSMSPAVAPSL